MEHTIERVSKLSVPFREALWEQSVFSKNTTHSLGQVSNPDQGLSTRSPMHWPLGNCASHCASCCDSHESVNLQAILPLIRKIYHSVILKDTAKYRQKARQNDHTERSKPKFYSIFWALLLENELLSVCFCTFGFVRTSLPSVGTVTTSGQEKFQNAQEQELILHKNSLFEIRVVSKCGRSVLWNQP